MVQVIPVAPPRPEQRDDAIAVLGEVVAQLAERVELLEARERIGRAVFVGAEAGSLKARE